MLFVADRSRIKQYRSTGETITYVGELFEYEDAATDKARYYVHTGSRAVAMVERVSGTNTTRYLHRDPQGSITQITSSGGSVTEALAYDAWGLRRDASDWSPLPDPFSGSPATERGYTGHEHLDNVGLIHMNGRVQDPKLGAFISADPFIQAPYHTQSHHRLSYVMNNPATLVDPSGFQWTWTLPPPTDPYPGHEVFSRYRDTNWNVSVVEMTRNVDMGGDFIARDTLGRGVCYWADELAPAPDRTFSIGRFEVTWWYRDNFAGRMFESGNAASIGVGFSPAGIVADLYTSVTGEDYFTEEKVSGWMRLAVLLPGVSELRKGDNVVDAARAGTKVPLPSMKSSPFGPKIEDVIPRNGVPRNWSRSQIEDAIVDYRTSITSRRAELSAFDALGGGSATQRLAHAQRITAEEAFLSSLEKALGR